MKKKTLVIGALTYPSPYSNMAIKWLVEANQPTVALGLRKGEVEGVKIETEKLAYKNVDTIMLYLGAKN